MPSLTVFNSSFSLFRMSYGAKGPPKGYSVPRDDKGVYGTQLCQKCGEKGHWTFECKANLQERKSRTRLSRTQMLRKNIEHVPKEAAPPLSEKEADLRAEASKKLLHDEATRTAKRKREEDSGGARPDEEHEHTGQAELAADSAERK